MIFLIFQEMLKEFQLLSLRINHLTELKYVLSLFPVDLQLIEINGGEGTTPPQFLEALRTLSYQ
jgi:hypothetical protein